MPRASKTCGGLTNFDVQAVGVVPPIVEGAEVIIATAPQAADECTERSAESPHGNGVGADERIVAEGGGKNQVAAAEPARMPQSEIGVRGGPEGVAADGACQEISQTPPTTRQATARTLHQMYQGIERVLAETRSAVRAWSVAGSGRVPAICALRRQCSRRDWLCTPAEFSLQRLVYIGQTCAGMNLCASGREGVALTG